MITSTSDAIKNFIKKRIRQNQNLEDLDIVKDILDNTDSFDDFFEYLKMIEPDDITFQEDQDKFAKRELEGFYSLIKDRNSRKNATIVETQYSNNTVLSIPGSNDENNFSKYINNILIQRKNDLDSVNQLKNECETIVNLLPTINDSNDRIGLVIGKVQSGKTSTFNGLISAAIDLKYNVIIIVSGLKENLRAQTQKRFESDVVDILQPSDNHENSNVHFISLTSVDRASQNFTPGNRIFGNLTSTNPSNVVYGVYLKNGSNLRKLIKKIQNTNQNYLKNIKALIIDDESDEATPNTSGDINNPVTINRLLRLLRISLNKATYLQFTATPFANILNEMGDITLYPRNFIHVLDTPKKYFGPLQLFGDPDLNEEEENYVDPLDVIRYVPDLELKEILEISNSNDFENKNLLKLQESLLWFFISTAVRKFRGSEDFSTMLIHTSGRILKHQLLYEYTNKKIDFFKKNTVEFIELCIELWGIEKDKIKFEDLNRVFPEYGLEFDKDPEFKDFKDYLVPILNETSIRIDNGDADSSIRLNYDENAPKYQIAIGGNTLSRGLTLYGLTSCYFVRKVSNFDTLMQMGRWFGYKIGFETLPRIWTTFALREGFRNLVAMEIHLKNDIKTKYSNGLSTPRQIAPKILRRPDFQITRRNAMRRAQLSEVDFSGTALQTIMFANEKSQLTANEELTREFLEAVINENPQITDDIKSTRIVFNNLGLNLVKDFLNNYQSIEDGRGFNLNKINQFIDKNQDLFNNWNVAVIGGSKENSYFNFGKFTVSRMNRSRIKIFDNDIGGRVDKLNLKGIMSKDDSFIDIPDIPSEFKETREKSILFRSKKNLPSLLIIYPIDKDSKPVLRNSKSSIQRFDLNADEHLIGIAMILNLGINKTVDEYVKLEISDFNEYSAEDNNDDEIFTENENELDENFES